MRVSDPDLLAAFRARMDTAARRYLGSLLDAPGAPEAIWFFRVDPRPAG